MRKSGGIRVETARWAVVLILTLAVLWGVGPVDARGPAQESPLSPVATASPLAPVAPAQAAPPSAETGGTTVTLPLVEAAPGPSTAAIPEGIPRRTSTSMVLVALVLIGLLLVVGVVMVRTRSRRETE